MFTLWVSDSLPEVYKSRKGPVDIVVGSKGTPPLDLSLCCALFAKPSTGLVSQKSVGAALSQPHIASLIKQKAAIALGDSYAGHPIIWTDQTIFDFYDSRLAHGRYFARPMEIVVGANVAKAEGLRLGQALISTHGLDEDAENHTLPYTVVGILNPTGNASDDVLFARRDSIPLMHGHEHEEEHFEGISAYIVRLKDSTGHVLVPTLLKDDPYVTAASPLLELSKLRAAFRPIEDIIRLQSQWLLAFASLAFIGLIGLNISRSQPELALLRQLGSSDTQIWLVVFGQAVLLFHLALVVGGAISVAAILLWQEPVMILGLWPDYGQIISPLPTLYAFLWGLSFIASLPVLLHAWRNQLNGMRQ